MPLPRPTPVFALPLAVLAVTGCADLHRPAGVAAGYISHELCSGVFISGQNPDAYYREAIAPTLSVADPLASHSLDRAHGEATASFAGLVTRKSVYLGPQGCLMLHAATAVPPTPRLPSPTPSLMPPIAGPDVVEPTAPALKAALDHAFAEPDRGPHRWTKAVVVLKDGRVVAERYAPGYGVDTPIQGWSMTKSVTNALIGVLVRQGRLSVDGPAPVAAWSNPGDPRHAISVDNLLRMTSGLDIGQSLTSDASTAWDPTTHMVFDTDDMAAFAEKARLKAPPGTWWNYTNGNTLLLSRMIRDRTGGDTAHVLAFIHRELFDKLGMEHAVLEFDAAGTPIGASQLWASGRDWARFGQLYLDDGVVGGERVLPEGWVDYSARLTPGSDHFGYGAGFWTNRGGSTAARERIAAGIPADAFMARGSQGQYVVIIPSRRLVVVRLGMAYTDRGDIVAEERLISEVVAADSPPTP